MDETDTSSSYLDWIKGLGSAATGVIGALNQPRPQVDTPAARAPMNWKPIIYGALALLAVAVIVTIFRRK